MLLLCSKVVETTGIEGGHFCSTVTFKELFQTQLKCQLMTSRLCSVCVCACVRAGVRVCVKVQIKEPITSELINVWSI